MPIILLKFFGLPKLGITKVFGIGSSENFWKTYHKSFDNCEEFSIFLYAFMMKVFERFYWWKNALYLFCE